MRRPYFESMNGRAYTGRPRGGRACSPSHGATYSLVPHWVSFKIKLPQRGDIALTCFLSLMVPSNLVASFDLNSLTVFNLTPEPGGHLE